MRNIFLLLFFVKIHILLIQREPMYLLMFVSILRLLIRIPKFINPSVGADKITAIIIITHYTNKKRIC